MKEFIKALIYGPDDKPSLTDTMALTSIVYFFVVTSYLVLTGQAWQHYEVFAGLTCGGGLVTKLSGKYINNK